MYNVRSQETPVAPIDTPTAHVGMIVTLSTNTNHHSKVIQQICFRIYLPNSFCVRLRVLRVLRNSEASLNRLYFQVSVLCHSHERRLHRLLSSFLRVHRSGGSEVMTWRSGSARGDRNCQTSLAKTGIIQKAIRTRTSEKQLRGCLMTS